MYPYLFQTLLKKGIVFAANQNPAGEVTNVLSNQL